MDSLTIRPGQVTYCRFLKHLILYRNYGVFSELEWYAKSIQRIRRERPKRKNLQISILIEMDEKTFDGYRLSQCHIDGGLKCNQCPTW